MVLYMRAVEAPFVRGSNYSASRVRDARDASSSMTRDVMSPGPDIARMINRFAGFYTEQHSDEFGAIAFSRASL